MHYLSVPYRSITLDTTISSLFYHIGEWTPELRRNRAPYLLRALVSKLYGASNGFRFDAHVRASHAALGAKEDISRGWTCTLMGRLVSAGWIKTEAPRLPDGTQEVTIIRAGPMLWKLLFMLWASGQRPENKRRVNDPVEKLPSKEDVEKNLLFLRNLQKELAEKLGSKKEKRW